MASVFWLSVYMCAAVRVVAGSIHNWSFTSAASAQYQAILGYPPPSVHDSISYYGWTGGDVGTSIQLQLSASSTYLWIFGDTIIASYNNTNNVNQRFNATYDHLSSCNPFAHSSIGLYNIDNNLRQQTTNHIQFYYKYSNENSVQSFFQPHPSSNDDIDEFWWTTAGIADPASHRVLLLMTNIKCNTSAALGFDITGSSVLVINDSSDDPLQWTYVYQRVPNTNSTLNWFAGISFMDETDSDMVYWIGTMNAQNVNCLAKISLADLMLFKFDSALFYGYNKHNANELDWFSWNNVGRLQWIIQDTFGASELTLNYHEDFSAWYTFLIPPFSTNVLLYMSKGSTIWSEYESVIVYKIPNPWNNLNLYFCYASKTHSEFNGVSDLVFTYVCNTWSGSTLYAANNASVYIPRFVVVNYTKI